MQKPAMSMMWPEKGEVFMDSSYGLVYAEGNYSLYLSFLKG
jgi:hypothetical protein